MGKTQKQNSDRTDSEQDKEEHRRTRPMRQRRRIAGKRTQHNDKYPPAFNLLVAEFKLQRTAGSKVSKLWFKKRMKLKIGACYGTEEAAKFKGSSNWFQRFKKKMQSGTEEKDQQEETSPLKLTPSIEDGCLKIDTKLISTRFLSHL